MPPKRKKPPCPSAAATKPRKAGLKGTNTGSGDGSVTVFPPQAARRMRPASAQIRGLVIVVSSGEYEL
jgi:hypothetical protein